MDLLDEQFEALRHRQRYAGATLVRQPGGTAVITIPDYQLPPGWNQATTTVYFVAPVGYPMARPDTFWTDAGLRLASGAMPMNTGSQAAPGVPPNALWFSYHPNAWHPNRDTLKSYLGMIGQRLKEAR